MTYLIEDLVGRISELDNIHGKKLKKYLELYPKEFLEDSDIFYTKVFEFFSDKGNPVDIAADCYLHIVKDMVREQFYFMKNKKYSSNSYTEVYERVYNNPEVMLYHMNGLLVSQYLWKQHVELISFFKQGLPAFCNKTNSYLEIAGGHGIYLLEALKVFTEVTCDFVDISETSIAIAKRLIGNSKVKYILSDIFSYNPECAYDFITFGEILEHLEKPEDLMAKVNQLLVPKGTAFFTVPINSPAIDHIYLFSNIDQVRRLVVETGFKIISEKITISEDYTLEYAEKKLVPIIFGAFIQKI